jgi:dihydrofolate reductase
MPSDLSLVVAVAENGVIGRDNTLPWLLPADLRHFRRVTLGHSILMGRRTHEAIGRPLPHRRNIVLSRDPAYRAPGCEVVESLQTAIDRVGAEDELMVIGGAVLFWQTLPMAERIYLTRVRAWPEGDVRFPPIDAMEWETLDVVEHPADALNAFACSFVWLRRRRPGSAGAPRK